MLTFVIILFVGSIKGQIEVFKQNNLEPQFNEQVQHRLNSIS
jgi:hypothetical protein